jgi:hypothetical protein
LYIFIYKEEGKILNTEKIIFETPKDHDKALTIREIADKTGETPNKVTMANSKTFQIQITGE